MHKVGLLGCTVVTTRRRGALSLFRLAGVVLRGTTGLYEKQLIPRASVRAALSIAGLLQRWAAALHPCLSPAITEIAGGVGAHDRICRRSP
jgi:hypothetical protein